MRLSDPAIIDLPTFEKAGNPHDPIAMPLLPSMIDLYAPMEFCHPKRALWIAGTSCPDTSDNDWQQHGFFVLPALNSQEAIPLIETTHFDAVVIDGTTTSDEKISIVIAARERKIPVIALTSRLEFPSPLFLRASRVRSALPLV